MIIPQKAVPPELTCIVLFVTGGNTFVVMVTQSQPTISHGGTMIKQDLLLQFTVSGDIIIALLSPAELRKPLGDQLLLFLCSLWFLNKRTELCCFSDRILCSSTFNSKWMQLQATLNHAIYLALGRACQITILIFHGKCDQSMRKVK